MARFVRQNYPNCYPQRHTLHAGSPLCNTMYRETDPVVARAIDGKDGFSLAQSIEPLDIRSALLVMELHFFEFVEAVHLDEYSVHLDIAPGWDWDEDCEWQVSALLRRYIDHWE